MVDRNNPPVLMQYALFGSDVALEDDVTDWSAHLTIYEINGWYFGHKNLDSDGGIDDYRADIIRSADTREVLGIDDFTDEDIAQIWASYEAHLAANIHAACGIKVGDDWFLPGFGTVRQCLDCDSLVTGGPTRCQHCARKRPRYLIFQYGRWYPNGGYNDFVGSYVDLDEAKSLLDAFMQDGDSSILGHVVDIDTGGIVYALCKDDDDDEIIPDDDVFKCLPPDMVRWLSDK